MSEHLGKKAVIIGKNGKQMVVDLDYWDEASQTYEGSGKFRGTIKVKVTGGTEAVAGFFGGQQFGWSEATIQPVFFMKGLRPYPYAERPNADFQFVLLGQDVTPLSQIGTTNASNVGGESSGGNPPVETVQEQKQEAQSPIHPADRDGNRVFSAKDVKKWNAEHPDDPITEGPY